MSMSGKIEPIVQAAMAAFAVAELIAAGLPPEPKLAGSSLPAKKALPANAPTIPCVIVSIVSVSLDFSELGRVRF